MKDGESINKPPFLDGTNYDYYKFMMISFLKFMCNKAWKYVIKGWKYPVINSKPKVEWTNVEDDEAFRKSKALNSFFNGVGKNMFMLINICLEAKEAWEIIITGHEGTSKGACQGCSSLLLSLII